MQRSARAGETHYQAARIVLVQRIPLYYLSSPDCLSYLRKFDISKKALVNGMFRELKLAALDFKLYRVQNGHLCQRFEADDVS